MKVQKRTSISEENNLERVVLYARVSSDDRGKDGRNLKGQIEMCQEYAQQRGYHIVSELREDDRGVSGYEIDLPKLNRVREMAQAGLFDVLVVRELDRLSRNLAKQLILEEELKRADVRVEYVLADYDDTPEGRLSKNVRAIIAEYEREKIKERMERGRRLKVRNGSAIGDTDPPYGYRLITVGNRKSFQIDNDKAEVVRLIFSLYLNDGLSLHAIAKKLKTLQIPSPGYKRRGGKRKKSEPCKWYRGTVRDILANETYTGTWYYNKFTKKSVTQNKNGETVTVIKMIGKPRKEWIDLPVPVIIPQEVFDDTQEKLEYNKINAKRNRKHDYLLTGHCFCGECGSRMSGCSGGSQTKKIYYYYRCPANGKQRLHYCNLSCFFPAGKVEQRVWTWLKSLLMEKDKLHAGLKDYQANEVERLAPIQRQVDITDDLLRKIKIKHERLVDLYTEGIYTLEEVAEQKKQYEAEIHSLEQQRTKLAEQLENTLTDERIADIEAFAEKVRKGLSKADETFAAKHKLIQLLRLKVRLVVETDQKVAYVECVLGNKPLPIATAAPGRKPVQTRPETVEQFRGCE